MGNKDGLLVTVNSTTGGLKDSPESHGRLCLSNPFIPSLKAGVTPESVDQQGQRWLADRAGHEKRLWETTQGKYGHEKFGAFVEMAPCDYTCTGKCSSDTSKRVCGLQSLHKPCVIYSIGGNNNWEFEKFMYHNTPCDIYTFDCTGSIKRFHPPKAMQDRHYFYHWCLNTKHIPKPTIKTKKNPTAVKGEMLTLPMIQQRLNHTTIDLLKMDIEGYEWPIFDAWYVEARKNNGAMDSLPMQVTVEVHYRSQMKGLSPVRNGKFKNETDLIGLQAHFLEMGYAVAIRDDNPHCRHCTELTLLRYNYCSR